MCQHLEGLIRGVQKESQDLREELGRADREISALRAAQGSSSAAISVLQEGQQKANLAIDSVRKDTLRTIEKVSTMARQIDVQGEKVQQQREVGKLVDTGMGTLKQEVANIGAKVKELQSHCENGLGTELVHVKGSLKQTQATLLSTKEDLERVKASSQEDRAMLRQESAALSRLSDDFARLCTETGTLDNRLGETIAHLKSTRGHLAQTNTALVKLHEEHKGLKSTFEASQDVAKKLGQTVKKVVDNVDTNNAKLANLADQLLATRAGMLGNKDQIEKATLRLCACEDAQERSQTDTAALQMGMENMKTTVVGLKERLRETNALVLPNLQMGAARTRQSTPRSGKTSAHGSLQSTSPLSLQSTATSWIGASGPP